MTKKGQVRRTSRRAYRPKRRSHNAKPVIHLLPDLFEVGGVSAPLFENYGGGNWSPLDAVVSAFHGGSKQEVFDSVVGNFTSISTLIPAAKLVVGGLILRYVGKKTGLGKLGTKRVKLL
jgi:hypothetical protein